MYDKCLIISQGVETPGCPTGPVPDRGTGRRSMGSRHLLLRSSYVSEGRGGAQTGAACFRLTPPTDDASNVRRRALAESAQAGHTSTVSSGRSTQW